MKTDLIKLQAKTEMLTAENTLLKTQQGEEEEVLILPPEVQDTIMGSITQALSKKWELAMNKMKTLNEEILENASAGVAPGH